jgi:methylated-DNA-[protein]-cysteine S-methyltransferase
MKTFKDKVLDVVRAIPEGETFTYKEVAVRAGNPKASRAVGNFMARNWDPTVPCHRVIRSDGKLGGYNRGAEEKERKLKAEGVDIYELWC